MRFKSPKRQKPSYYKPSGPEINQHSTVDTADAYHIFVSETPSPCIMTKVIINKRLLQVGKE